MRCGSSTRGCCSACRPTSASSAGWAARSGGCRRTSAAAWPGNCTTASARTSPRSSTGWRSWAKASRPRSARSSRPRSACAPSTLQDTRELSRLLRPPILDDLGLEPALRWLARSQGESSGIDVQAEIEPLPPLDGELQTLLFRVAQEAVNNAVKHSGAGTILMRLVARDGALQLQVADDGRGCDPAAAIASGGSGLGGIRERLRLHEGRLELHSAPGEGTRVRAMVPLPPA
jgi:signal transduction histidine kinase